MAFDEITRLHDGAWDVPDGWQQGRGAFGGLTLAALARAASEHCREQGGDGARAGERPLRAITAEIPSAVMVGPARVKLTTLRVGSALTTIAAQLEQRDEIAAHAVMTFGRTRAVDFERVAIEPPAPPPFADLPIVPDVPFGPPFARHFEYRIAGGVPFSGAREAATCGWVRLLEPGDVPRHIALLALVDAWFPSALPVLPAPRPFATVSFAAQLFEAAWSLGEPLYHRSRMVASQRGYMLEVRELWTARGELCAVNQQTFAVIK